MADQKQCPSGSKWSVTKSTCLTDADYTAMLQYYIVTGRYDLVNQENGSTGFDPLGINALGDRISKFFQNTAFVAAGLVLVLVAIVAWVNQKNIKITK